MADVTPNENGIGARVTGLSLAEPLRDADQRTIEDAWNDHHALVFPDQHALPIEAQAELVGRFAPVIEERMPGDAHSFVTNEDGYNTDDMTPGYREGRLTPHMDYTYTPYPAEVISLYAVHLPEGETTTTFYSNVAPLARMPASLRERIAGYSIFCAHDLAAMRPDVELYREPRTDPDAPSQSHVWPLVHRHPTKPGVEHLMCTLQQTERVVELSDPATDDRASRALLHALFSEYLYVPENRYVHAWRPGDLVVWDNLALQHGREPCPAGVGPRTLRRVAGCAAGNGVTSTVEFLGLAGADQAYA